VSESKKKLKPQFTGNLQILQPATNKNKTKGHYRDFSHHKKVFLDKLKLEKKALEKAAKELEKQEK